MVIPPDAALIIVDIQNDFCPGGTLPVAGGDQIIPAIHQLIGEFRNSDRPIIASRDWHPPETSHFAPIGPWPKHCIADTNGAAFHPSLRLPSETLIVQKGMGSNEDAYSAFDAVAADGASLDTLLRRRHAQVLFVVGLATDYCVRATALEGLRLGYAVRLVRDAIRGVDVRVGDSERAISDMQAAGAILTTVQE